MAGITYSEQVTAASGDVERAEISVAKGAVGRPVHRHGMRLQDAACGRKDIQHGPRPSLTPATAGDDVALSIQAHAIDASLDTAGVLPESVQYCVSPQGVIRLQGISTQFPH